MRRRKSPLPSKVELEMLIEQGATVPQIRDTYGVSRHVARDFLKAHGLKARPANKLDWSALDEPLRQAAKSLSKQIHLAKRIGVCVPTLRRRLVDLGLHTGGGENSR